MIDLAQAIETEQAFHGLPILADALEEAGCNLTELLAHCLDGGADVLGCWALDQILGRS